MGDTNIENQLQEKVQKHHTSRHRRAGWLHSTAAGICMTVFGAGAGTGIVGIVGVVDSMSDDIHASSQAREDRNNGLVDLNPITENDEKVDGEATLMNWGHFLGTLGAGGLMIGFGSAASRRFERSDEHKRGDLAPYNTSMFKNDAQELS